MANPRKIIVCLATSPSGKVVAAEGLRFCRVLDATPVFLNVGDDTPERRESLLALIGEAEQPELLIRSGDPFSVIVASAAEQDAEMIILGALNRDPTWVRVWGSVARKIARRAPCSVLLLSSGSTRRTGQRIVAGVALDGKSAQTMPLILQIARRGESESIHFVKEFSLDTALAEDDASRDAISEDERIVNRQRVETRLLADFLSAFDLSGLNVRLAALPGREGVQVVEYARRQHADLIILPAPPRRLNIWDRFFRHPLESVLIELPCALLIQRPNRKSSWSDAGASDLHGVRQK